MTRNDSRLLFARSSSLEDVQNAVSELPPHDRTKAVIHYAIDPHQEELPVHYDLPNQQSSVSVSRTPPGPKRTRR